jgi:hypothetical protein
LDRTTIPNVDAPILDGLSGLIESTGYQQASPDALPDGVNLDFAGEPTPFSQQQPGNAVAPVQQRADQPVQVQQPAQQQGPDPRLAHFEQIAFEAAQKRIEAEEAKFQLEIRDLSETEQRLALAERERDPTKEVNQWLNQERQRERSEIQAQQQQASKKSWAFIYATQAGLPFDNEGVQAALLGARNREQMAKVAADLANVVGGNRGQQAQQQLQNGTFAAGGNNGAAATPVKPVPRSGDLDTLIGSRRYQTVNWG